MGIYCPHVTIDRGSYVPVFRQLVDLIRKRITSEEFPPGSLLPTEQAMVQEYGVGRNSVRSAMRELRSEGLVVTDRSGSHVRAVGERQTVDVEPGTTITARMPTEQERRAHSIGEGVPVLVVGDRVYPADRFELLV